MNLQCGVWTRGEMTRIQGATSTNLTQVLLYTLYFKQFETHESESPENAVARPELYTNSETVGSCGFSD